jgi:hypothetical protein
MKLHSPYSLSIWGGEEGLGDFLRLDERPSVQATQNKQKWKFFWSQIVWFFYEKFKGKKNKRTFDFGKKFEFWIAMVCLSFYAHILGYLKHIWT